MPYYAKYIVAKIQTIIVYTMKGELVPTWLEILLTTQFFTICMSHLSSARNECNLFCIDCEAPQAAFCYYCRKCHDSTHRIIQVKYIIS
jgi:hypothetical protein